MQKILGVMGSPRKKGNTHILISRILDGARSEGARGDTLFLGDLAIRECDGCHACWQGKECSKNDDMNDIVAFPASGSGQRATFGRNPYLYIVTKGSPSGERERHPVFQIFIQSGAGLSSDHGECSNRLRHAGILVWPNCLDEGIHRPFCLFQLPREQGQDKGEAGSLGSALRGRRSRSSRSGEGDVREESAVFGNEPDWLHHCAGGYQKRRDHKKTRSFGRGL